MNKDDQFRAAVKVMFAALETIVGSSDPWREKLEHLLAEADDSDMTNLSEFKSWLDSAEV